MYLSLQDAYGRDMVPNRMQPGAADMYGGGDNLGAAMMGGSLGGAGLEAFSEYPSYAAEVGANAPMSPMSPQLPMQQMPQNMMQGSYQSCSTCNEAPAGMRVPPPGSGMAHSNMYGGASMLSGGSHNGQTFQAPVFYQDMVQDAYKDPMQMRTAGHLPKAQVTLNQQIVTNLKKNIMAVTKELGVPPNWVDLSPDGGAVWKYSRMIKGKSIWCRVFNRVEVHAERKAGREPIPHVASITSVTKVKLDCDLVKDLQREMPQLSYCPETQQLRITMDSLPHNLSLLALVCSCQQGKFGVNKVRYYKLPKKYLGLTTPGNKRYKPGAKYSLIRFIKS